MMGTPHGNRLCLESPTQRHGPKYDNGAMVTTNSDGTEAVCLHCSSKIIRAHRRTGWWHVVQFCAEYEGCTEGHCAYPGDEWCESDRRARASAPTCIGCGGSTPCDCNEAGE